jgi:hypothetical protein
MACYEIRNSAIHFSQSAHKMVALKDAGAWWPALPTLDCSAGNFALRKAAKRNHKAKAKSTGETVNG